MVISDTKEFQERCDSFDPAEGGGGGEENGADMRYCIL